MEERKETREQEVNINTINQKTTVELGMKWFKFLIYFGLWAGAILNFVNGIRQITGSIYLSEGIKPDLVYKTFPSLKGVDIFFGLIFCAFAVFQIVTRFYLAGFKKSAPVLLHVVYVSVGIISLMYGIIVASIIESSIAGEMIGSLAGSVVILFINIKYFGNRKHLFVN